MIVRIVVCVCAYVCLPSAGTHMQLQKQYQPSPSSSLPPPQQQRQQRHCHHNLQVKKTDHAPCSTDVWEQMPTSFEIGERRVALNGDRVSKDDTAARRLVDHRNKRKGSRPFSKGLSVVRSVTLEVPQTQALPDSVASSSPYRHFLNLA